MSQGPEYETPGNPYVGMTTNERLSNAGLLNSWDIAAHARNREVMIRLLVQVGATEWHAAQIADTVIANPAMYGF